MGTREQIGGEDDGEEDGEGNLERTHGKDVQEKDWILAQCFEAITLREVMIWLNMTAVYFRMIIRNRCLAFASSEVNLSIKTNTHQPIESLFTIFIIEHISIDILK